MQTNRDIKLKYECFKLSPGFAASAHDFPFFKDLLYCISNSEQFGQYRDFQ